MKVLVAIKRVIDYNARIRIKPDQVSRVRSARHASTSLQQTHHHSDWRRARQRQNEHEPILRDCSGGAYDTCSSQPLHQPNQEALRLKESKVASEVLVVSVGPKLAQVLSSCF